MSDAALAAGASTAGGIMGLIGQLLTNKTNKDIAGANLALEKENLAYTKDIQQKAWGREDTAVQRRVSDLRAAGLSPVLAAGSSASSMAPVRTEAPQNRFQSVNPVEKAAAASELMLNLMRAKADISRTNADTARIVKEAEGRELENQFARNSLTDRLSLTRIATQHDAFARDTEQWRSVQEFEKSKRTFELMDQAVQAGRLENDLRSLSLAKGNYDFGLYQKLGWPTNTSANDLFSKGMLTLNAQMPLWMRLLGIKK